MQLHINPPENNEYQKERTINEFHISELDIGGYIFKVLSLLLCQKAVIFQHDKAFALFSPFVSPPHPFSVEAL